MNEIEINGQKYVLASAVQGVLAQTQEAWVMRLTDEELEELERMEREATPGPWGYAGDGFTDDVFADAECVASLRVHQNGDRTAANARFFAASRNALPSLLAEVRELRAVADAARSRLGWCECDWETAGHTGACLKLASALAKYDNGRRGGGLP